MYTRYNATFHVQNSLNCMHGEHIISYNNDGYVSQITRLSATDSRNIPNLTVCNYVESNLGY